MKLESLSPANIETIRTQLEHPFDLMLEAVAFRIDSMIEEEVKLYPLIPEREYRNIRTYVSDLSKLKRLLTDPLYEIGYVSFIGEHRDGAVDAIEKIDNALIRSSAPEWPILAYFSLQDPRMEWINLVLFDDLTAISNWVAVTNHKQHWEKSAVFFHAIDKSLGTIRITDNRVQLKPTSLTVRNYDEASG